MCDWFLIFLYIFCSNVWFETCHLFNMDNNDDQQKSADIHNKVKEGLCQKYTETSLLKQYQEQRRQFIEYCEHEEKLLSWQRFGYSSTSNQYNSLMQPMWKSRRYPRSLLCQMVR